MKQELKNIIQILRAIFSPAPAVVLVPVRNRRIRRPRP
jgi:hypothetical protein